MLAMPSVSSQPRSSGTSHHSDCQQTPGQSYILFARDWNNSLDYSLALAGCV